MDYSEINDELELAARWDKEQLQQYIGEVDCGIYGDEDMDGLRYYNDMFDRTELTDEEWDGTDWDWRVKKATRRVHYWELRDSDESWEVKNSHKSIYNPPTPPQYSEKDPRLQSNEEWLHDYEEALHAEKSGYRKRPQQKNR